MKLVFHVVTLSVDGMQARTVKFHSKVCWYLGKGQTFSIKCDIEHMTCLPVVQMEGSRHHF